jgi:hypothetical protein
LRAAKVARVQGAVVAAVAGASETAAIMAMERTTKRKRRFIRHLLILGH